MADAIQPATRNLYQKKFAFLEYRDGAGHSYAEQIRLQSWPNRGACAFSARPRALAATTSEDHPPRAIPHAFEQFDVDAARRCATLKYTPSAR